MIVEDRKKSKDRDSNARKDCKLLRIRPELLLDEIEVNLKALYILTRPQIRLLCNWISSFKLLDGCASNISHCIKWETLRITSFKSYDSHIFMQKLMIIALYEFLPSYIMDDLSE